MSAAPRYGVDINPALKVLFNRVGPAQRCCLVLGRFKPDRFMLGIFGGYAIYFPELFPTALRSTGTSFCYNVGRFLAASGPWTIGLLSSQVFGSTEEPLRYAGLAMCSVFLIGLVILPFAPETKGQPLPE